LYIYLYKINKG